DIIKITHPQNEDRLNSRFVLGVGDFSVDIYRWVIFQLTFTKPRKPLPGDRHEPFRHLNRL
ncbi:MAG: hypothetical protein LBK41_07730, partial [Clostridiales bacterium]|nr:hypothetical protein [Clostridiales bacterium]